MGHGASALSSGLSTGMACDHAEMLALDAHPGLAYFYPTRCASLHNR
jgi:hypothetical protein